MFAQSIRLAKSSRPTTPALLQDALDIFHSQICSLAFLLHSISTSVVETIQTDAHDLLLFLTYLSLSHGSRLSRRIPLPLASGYLLVVSISDTLAPIPNDILFHILYDWFALAPCLQYTNSGYGEFIPDHRSGHSSHLK